MEPTEGPRKLTNLQLELLKTFQFELPETQLLEIRALLTDYFANKVTDEMDALFAANGWGPEKIEEWSKEHLRTQLEEK